MPYTIPVRATALTTRPLINITQPMHPLVRFRWIDKPEYTDPTSVGMTKTMAAKGKPVPGASFRTLKRPA